MTCRSPRALSLCIPHPLDLVFPSMILEGPFPQLTRRSDQKYWILVLTPISKLEWITVNLSLLLGIRDIDAYFLGLWQWNEIRVLQLSSKFSTAGPKMCPFCHGSKNVSVGSYINLGSNPNLPLKIYKTLASSLSSLGFSFFFSKLEIIITSHKLILILNITNI